MIKNTIKINHPLTVIAVFSMLTEASAAVSLPYIDSEHQKIYVWFLIIFPSLLITLFFLTLNFNNKKLYTPADLSKAENTQEGISRPLDPCQEQANSPENTSTSAQLFIAPEKAHATLIAKSHVLGAELKTLHLIDLSHLHLVPLTKVPPTTCCIYITKRRANTKTTTLSITYCYCSQTSTPLLRQKLFVWLSTISSIRRLSAIQPLSATTQMHTD